MMSSKTCFLCDDFHTETLTCQNCEDVSFCKLHEKCHRFMSDRSDNNCFPIRIISKEGVGRCVVASRDILAGELLLEDYPVVFGPKDQYLEYDVGLEKKCVQCLQSTALKQCPRCQLFVCHKNEHSEISSLECSVESNNLEDDVSCSNLHQDECDIIVQLKDTIFEFLKENENSDSKENEYNDLKSKCIELVSECLCPLRLYIQQEKCQELRRHLDKLMDHNDDVTDEEERSNKITRISKIISLAILKNNLKNIPKQSDNNKEKDSSSHLNNGNFDAHVESLQQNGLDLKSEDTENSQEIESIQLEVQRCIGLLRTNCLNFDNKKGRIFYPLFSFLSHSCLNNAKHVMNPKSVDKKISLYSQVKIAKGEEVTITYTNLFRPTHERNENLMRQWHFTCSCQRCDLSRKSNDGNELGIYIGGILCPICKENLNPPDIDSNIDFWECISCGKRITKDAVVTLVGTLQHLLLEDTNCQDISEIREYLKMTENLLHKQHYLNLIAKRYLIQLLDKCNNDGSNNEIGVDGRENETTANEKIQICRELMTAFDTFDAGFSQTRGLTLFELTKAQLEKLNYLSAMEARQKNSSQSKTSETYSQKEVNSDLPNEILLLMEEIPTTIEEALRCLEHEMEGSHGKKAKEKLLNIKRQLLY